MPMLIWITEYWEVKSAVSDAVFIAVGSFKRGKIIKSQLGYIPCGKV